LPRGCRERDLRVLPAGLRARVRDRLGQDHRGAARLSHAALQPRRAPAAPQGARPALTRRSGLGNCSCVALPRVSLHASAPRLLAASLGQLPPVIADRRGGALKTKRRRGVSAILVGAALAAIFGSVERSGSRGWTAAPTEER